MRRGWVFVALGVVVIAGGVVGQPAPAGAQLRAASPSDPRATFTPGNLTSCVQLGFTDSAQLGSATGSSASDANVAGTAKANAGTIQPGHGQELDVAITSANVVIDAVVVKGGPAANVYTNPTVLPPTLPPDQHYISPFDGGGNIPDIGHWFVCYHFETPPPVGSLVVAKTVIAPNGIPAVTLPNHYTVLVNCPGDPPHENLPVILNAGGGAAPPLTGIPVGTTCTVVEQTPLPMGATVSYLPADANSNGVPINDTRGALVIVTNDLSGVPLATGTVHVDKVVTNVAPGVDVPDTFNALVECAGGITQAVTLPGTGGPGSPDLTVNAGVLCSVSETDVLPAGWSVTYAVDGGSSTSSPPLFGIRRDTTTTVTITNDATGVEASTTTASTTTTTTTTTTAPTTTTTQPDLLPTTTSAPGSDVLAAGATQSSGTGTTKLARTGVSTNGGIALGLLLIALGMMLVAKSRRPAARQ